MSVAEIAINAPAQYRVRGVVGVRQGESLQDAELGLDQVEPRGLGRGRYGVDPQLPQEGEETGMIVGVPQVVQDHEEPPSRIAAAQAPEGLAELGQALAFSKQAAEAVGMNVVESQKLFGSVQPPIGRPHALRPGSPSPDPAPHGFELQGTPFVETHYRRPRGAPPVERADAFFLRSKSGSWEVFQVRTRWAVSPSRRSKRRTHSSVTSGSNLFCRQYSASFGTDHVENGSPRSAGLDRATSTSSRSCAALRIGGRPLGLETCGSGDRAPESLRRSTAPCGPRLGRGPSRQRPFDYPGR